MLPQSRRVAVSGQAAGRRRARYGYLNQNGTRTARAENGQKRAENWRAEQTASKISLYISKVWVGWGTWIRTRTNGVRVRGSTVNLFPSRDNRLRHSHPQRKHRSWRSLVPEAGLEPAWIAPADFESAASTNSATRADPTAGAEDHFRLARARKPDKMGFSSAPSASPERAPGSASQRRRQHCERAQVATFERVPTLGVGSLTFGEVRA